jgi:hypothetical protein
MPPTMTGRNFGAFAFVGRYLWHEGGCCSSTRDAHPFLVKLGVPLVKHVNRLDEIDPEDTKLPLTGWISLQKL